MDMPVPTKIAERLIAHARLCRQMARETWNERAAVELERMAEECVRAATPDLPNERNI